MPSRWRWILGSIWRWSGKILVSIHCYFISWFWRTVGHLLHALLLLTFLFYRCIMVLNCGYGGLSPCPVCLVPCDKLSDLSIKYDRRLGIVLQELVCQAQTLSKSEGKKLLKPLGLCCIKVLHFTFSFAGPRDFKYFPECFLGNPTQWSPWSHILGQNA